eukprot:4217660-Amphidinium_carterae.1
MIPAPPSGPDHNHVPFQLQDAEKFTATEGTGLVHRSDKLTRTTLTQNTQFGFGVVRYDNPVVRKGANGMINYQCRRGKSYKRDLPNLGELAMYCHKEEKKWSKGYAELLMSSKGSPPHCLVPWAFEAEILAGIRKVDDEA